MEHAHRAHRCISAAPGSHPRVQAAGRHQRCGPLAQGEACSCALFSRAHSACAAHVSHSQRVHRLRGRRQRRIACLAEQHQRYEGRLIAEEGTRIGLVVGKFNSLVTDRLLDGALAGLRATGVNSAHVTIAHVPGSFELPVVASSMAQSGAHHAVICIGAVVRGATTHYEAVCNAATSGCLSAGQSTGVPVIFGVMTTDTMEQALDRAGGKVGNKGYEAAITAVEMTTLMSQLHARGLAAPATGQTLTI